MASGKPRGVTLVVGAVVILGLSAALGWWLRNRQQKPEDEGPPLPTGSLGERVYRRYCAGCHGDEGRGDGAASARFNPPPTDFVKGPYKRGDSPEAIRKAVVDGVPPAMPPMQSLTKEELDALVAQVRKLAGKVKPLPAGMKPETDPRPAPAIDLADLDGRPARLDDLKGKTVLVYFWMTNCAPCAAELSNLAKLARRFESDGVRILAVCVDETDAAAVRRVAGEAAGIVRLNPDGRAQRLFDIQVSPTLLLIDREGRAIARGSGTHPSTDSAFADWLHDRAKP